MNEEIESGLIEDVRELDAAAIHAADPQRTGGDSDGTDTQDNDGTDSGDADGTDGDGDGTDAGDADGTDGGGGDGDGTDNA
ncbi:MAG TPA: hypothetical protein VGD79_05770 [Thermoanaerobaculia bacterium]|jgi:hypothetical protein